MVDRRRVLAAGALALLAVGCGTADGTIATDVPTQTIDASSARYADATIDQSAVTEVGAPTDAGQSPPPMVGPQTPPSSGRVDMEAWLTAGHYRSWHCEPAPHASRSPSPHGINRICSNELLSGSSGDGPYPVGAAAVKELLSSAGVVTGYAVYLKVAVGTGGENWYWFERIGTRYVADGLGTSGPARTICVGCHVSAPRDFVFTHVR